jgi:hypothetical protein
MANIRKHIAPSAQAGQRIRFYMKSTEIGSGTFETVEDLRLAVRAQAGLPKLELKGRVDIAMDGYGPSGKCRVVLTPDGGKATEHQCDYTTTGVRLDINFPFPMGWVGLQPEGRDVTWIRTAGGLAWYSARPAAVAAPPEGFPDAPDEAEEPAAAASGD